MSHSINMLGQLASYVEKNCIRFLPHTTPKNKLQMTSRPKRLRECFYDGEVGKGLFDETWESEIKKGNMKF